MVEKQGRSGKTKMRPIPANMLVCGFRGLHGCLSFSIFNPVWGIIAQIQNPSEMHLARNRSGHRLVCGHESLVIVVVMPTPIATTTTTTTTTTAAVATTTTATATNILVVVAIVVAAT